MQPNRVNRRNSNRATNDLLHFLQITLQLLVAVENFFGGLINSLPFAGKIKLLLAPVDHERLKVALHGTGLLTNSGLGNSNLAALEKLLVSTKSAKILKFSICIHWYCYAQYKYNLSAGQSKRHTKRCLSNMILFANEPMPSFFE